MSWACWRSTWLLRVGDGRPALLLDFAAGAAGFATDHVLATVLDGALHPHPGRSGLRMTPAGELRVAGDWDGPPASATVVAALDAWGAAIAADPFLERLAVAVADVVPVRRHGRWWVGAADGAALPLAGEEPWTLVGLAGGPARRRRRRVGRRCSARRDDSYAPISIARSRSRQDEALDLYKKVATALRLNAESVPDSARGSKAAKQTLRTLERDQPSAFVEPTDPLLHLPHEREGHQRRARPPDRRRAARAPRTRRGGRPRTGCSTGR